MNIGCNSFFSHCADLRWILGLQWVRIWTQLRLFRALLLHWYLFCWKFGSRPAPANVLGAAPRALTCSLRMQCRWCSRCWLFCSCWENWHHSRNTRIHWWEGKCANNETVFLHKKSFAGRWWVALCLCRMLGSVKNTLEISSSTSWRTFPTVLRTCPNIKRKLISRG